jgi:cyclophilin family peptidyl-prolyl cis-trans isomerase/HEAT repeat protein
VKRSVLALALAMSACASAPVAPPPLPVAPTISFDEKIAWILRLEDERVLRDPEPPAAPAPPPPAQPMSRRSGPPPPAPPPPPPTPDLVRLLTDGEARIRRRAALAIGRVGLGEGVPPLVDRLGDPDAEVRQMAAFALGLIGDPSARGPLASALSDPDAMVKGSAAEALGLIGDRSDAGTIAGMASEVLAAGGFGERPADEDDLRRDTPAGAFRLALTALARLKAYEPLAAVVLDASGVPRVRWWPVAFALERTEDPRARTALRALATDTHFYTRALAIKGLGTLKDGESVPLLLKATAGERTTAIEAIRALGRIGDRSAAPALLKLVTDARTDPLLRLETVTALGGIGGEGASEVLVDLLTDPQPALRAEVLRALAKIDSEGFVFVLSGLDPDPHWNVRAALATVLGTLTPEAGLPRLRLMLDDQDQRVIPAVLASLVRLRAPDAAALASARLEADDPVVRAAAATALGQLKVPSGVGALAGAYRAAQRDPIYVARTAALTALSAYGNDAAPVLTEALKDPDWAVRVRAAELLRQIDPTTDAVLRIRPAPSRHPREYFASKRLTNPQVSTHVYLETDRGSVQLELAVLDAPLNVDSFITLARKGYYNGTTIHRVVPNFVVQDGDPRGDGEGGPGYTLRDELSQTPFGRGVVGVALDWEDTGGSQFFITHSPQPHLDARYTVIGRVVSGMDVVDTLQPWDAIRSIRVWDGQQ